MSSPDQEELEIRKAVLLLAMQQNNMETFRRLAVELKIRGLPGAIRSKAEARWSGDAGDGDEDQVPAGGVVDGHGERILGNAPMVEKGEL